MSVIDATKMWSKQGGAITSERADALDQKYSFTEAWQVLHTVDTLSNECLEFGGIPASGAQHESGYPAFVVKKDHSQISPILSIVTVSYEGESPDPASVEVEWTDATTTEPIDRDWNGEAILTVNGEPVEGLSMDVADQIVVIRRRFLTVDTAAIAAYRRATNSDTFLGWAPGTGRLVAYSAKNRFKYGAPQEQWDVTARIQFRQPYANTTNAQAWYKRWRHEGIYVKAADGTIRRALDQLGHEVSKPVLLKADGTQETNAAAAVFIHTQVYDSLPYSALGLI